MKVDELEISGSYLMTLPNYKDDRGSFENHFPQNELEFLPESFVVRQVNLSRNLQKGTLRGLHYQVEPYAESKIVSCVFGSVFDVIVDLRRDSKSFGRWQSIHLREAQNFIYVPPGVAHGFQTLEDNCVLQYLHSGQYSAPHSLGVRFDDSELDISWPLEVSNISLADQQLPNLAEMRKSHAL
jgi:dTDP-4-dehydrorhamnose 3,5-epimerase